MGRGTADWPHASSKAGLLPARPEKLVGVVAGEALGDVEIKCEEETGRLWMEGAEGRVEGL